MQDKKIRLRSVAKIFINHMIDEGVLNFDDEEGSKSLGKSIRRFIKQETPQDALVHPSLQKEAKNDIPYDSSWNVS